MSFDPEQDYPDQVSRKKPMPAATRIEIDLGEANAPLMAIYPGKLRKEAIDNLRESWRRACAGGAKVIALEGPVTVCQLINGRWQPLSP